MSELEGVGLTRRVRGGDLDILLVQIAEYGSWRGRGTGVKGRESSFAIF